MQKCWLIATRAVCILLPGGCWMGFSTAGTWNRTTSLIHTTQTHSVPVFEEAAKTEGDEFEDGFQHEGGGEKIVAILEDEIQGLKKEH